MEESGGLVEGDGRHVDGGVVLADDGWDGLDVRFRRMFPRRQTRQFLRDKFE